MEPNKSLDETVSLIAALLDDIQMSHETVFNCRVRRLTLQQVKKRTRSEGIGFLTKTLPRLGKAFDKALAEVSPLNATDLGFSAITGSKLPRFLGELFSRVLQPNGVPLSEPCVSCVSVLRQVLYLFYKYELPYTDEQAQQVIQKFERTEDDLSANGPLSIRLKSLMFSDSIHVRRFARDSFKSRTQSAVTREAKILLSNVFAFFDPKNIVPRHGPGAVATKQRLWSKFNWSNVSDRITALYPYDEYFCSSLGSVCDNYATFSKVTGMDLPARVILVPKDSRGPRLISCEPVDFQWIQQGLGRAIVELVESHETTRFNVNFTSQDYNRQFALRGSVDGSYATLDLNEASDRVSLELVRLLFPPHICEYLEGCRSLSTVLPNGKEIKLEKFAPMGSCLCFPILALTVWAILTAAAPDSDTRKSILVYGDDVIVPAAYAVNAMEQLESFGLKINRDKSCISGLFRESCGMDAYKGIDVTPVRLRTVWSSVPSPDVYTSWIAYANSFYDKHYYHVYDLIVARLRSIYGPIPGDDMNLSCPCLREVSLDERPKRRRMNYSLQKLQYSVYDVKSPKIHHTIDGWSMLLRYFTENASDSSSVHDALRRTAPWEVYTPHSAVCVGSYTDRRTSMLVRRWR
jgi:hypothetical protein